MIKFLYYQILRNNPRVRLKISAVLQAIAKAVVFYCFKAKFLNTDAIYGKIIWPVRHGTDKVMLRII